MDGVKGFRLTFVNDKPHFSLPLRQCRGLPNLLGTFRPPFQLYFQRLFRGRVFQPWRYGVGPYDYNKQSLFVGRRPSRWMHFSSLHPPSLGSFRVPGLHPSDPIRQSGPWASLFLWGWLHPFHMRERNECFLLIIRASSGRPTKRQAAPPPTFLWLTPAFSSMLIVRFCLSPLSAHCFGDTMVWSINFGFWVLNKNFRR